MALSKVKLRLCLLAFTLFLACLSVGLGDKGESLSSGAGVDHDGCVNRCEELKGKNVDEFAACKKGCGVNQRGSPRAEYEVCRLRCQVAERGVEQQRKCEQVCEERLREREQGRGEDVDEVERRDPEWEREEQRRREHEREERRRRERERERERGRGRRDENERDPKREQEERQRREQERRRREQEQRERERRGERDEEDDENQRDPDWRREQERREQERRRREQEQERRERQRRGGRDDEDENQRDPDWRREQKRREQEQERRERERRGGRDDEDENQRDPDWRREQERREQERRRREREQERREREHRGGRDVEDENQRDPDWRREQERRRREEEQREREWEREHGRRGREEQRSREDERRRHERQHGGRSRVNQVAIRRTEQEQSNNPYYFQEQRFQSRYRSDEGHWRVLERFSERSELLKGIKNQRLALLEARPHTFIVPHHLDAECVLLVVRGRATITTVVQEKRETRKESYNVESGDVMTIPAGTTLYLANQENEDLQIVKLVQPVNNPGEFKDYLSAGGESQAYYSVFSNDVLEAALNIPRDKLERIFKQRRERGGKIVRASQEQLRALSQRATSVRKGSRGVRAPIKLESQTPVYNNQYGQMFEACPDEFPQLRRTDVATSVVDIKQGGMMVPHFNSRATWVVFVSEGAGSFEMACPHIQSSQWQRGRREEERHWRREEEEEREERSGRFERVAGRLSEGGVLVIPAGHPIAIMASPNENLRLVGFGINAENNHRNFLAGRENIMNELDREAKELAFNVEGKQADEIFRSQRESFFTEGPEGGRRRSTERSPLLSILKLAGYF
ncbi:vicilin-like isoform X1 [Cucurbita maxima]|uniref:PV100 n=1 Tax=Cucurbita maxima TaxID=3661 RepID=Q9ZWI3_CUCMA|nr:vicilin-like isoform X1 [Cucurbita maxima]BAA34056.1 PV100 [Cucurbita maxima]